MFTHVYICRTRTILRKNKINIVCLNNAECLLFREFGGVGSEKCCGQFKWLELCLVYLLLD